MNDEHTSDDGSPAADLAAGRTGNHAVDRVLDSLDGLDGTPVDEHVTVFEGAHEQLRKALDGTPGPRDVPRPG